MKTGNRISREMASIVKVFDSFPGYGLNRGVFLIDVRLKEVCVLYGVDDRGYVYMVTFGIISNLDSCATRDDMEKLIKNLSDWESNFMAYYEKNFGTPLLDIHFAHRLADHEPIVEELLK